jgi:cardiolipin synthase A/B
MNLFPLILILAFIGALSFIALTLVLFASFGKRPLKLWSTEIAEIGTDRFFRTIAMTCGGSVGSQSESFTLLNETDDYFEDIFKHLEKAEQTINFMNFICAKGEVSDRLFKILKRKAQAGVEVRILLDGIGSLRAPKEHIQELEAEGGKVIFYKPLRFGKFTQVFRRNHRRSIVIDGRIGYIGGAAFSDRWVGVDGEPPFRDSMLRVNGPAAQHIQSAFTQLWADTAGELLSGDEFYPDFRGEQRYDENSNPIRFVSIISAPSMEMHPLSRFFWLNLAAARKSIYLTNPYFVPPRHIIRILCKKAKEGVDVQLLLPGKLIDVLLVRPAAQKYYKTLLSAGVKIYEYQPAILHAKHLVIDGVWSVLGSSNFDKRSLYLNKENVIGVFDKKLAATLEEVFKNDLKSAKKIILKKWSERPARHKLAENAASVVEEQL